MELQIDWTRCDGHGLCTALLDGYVGSDEWGFPILPPPGVQLDPRLVTQAVQACPALALRAQRPMRGGRR